MKLPKVKLPRMQFTPRAVKGIATAYFRTHHNRPEMQEKFLFSHLKRHSDTAFGTFHELQNVASIEEFQKAIPLQDYDSLYPWIERCLRGEKDVLLH